MIVYTIPVLALTAFPFGQYIILLVVPRVAEGTWTLKTTGRMTEHTLQLTEVCNCLQQQFVTDVVFWACPHRQLRTPLRVGYISFGRRAWGTRQ